MIRLTPFSCAWILAAALTFIPTGARAQKPCTDHQATESPGSLRLDRPNQNLQDSLRHFQPDPAAFKKINQAIAILKQAFGDIKGAEGTYTYDVYRPGPKSIALRSSIRVGLCNYYCAPPSSPPNEAGKILPEAGTGTWITIDFNSLGTLVEERSNLGNDLKSPQGEMIYMLPKESDFRGNRLFHPDKYGYVSNVLVFTASGKFPFKPLSREEFLEGREKGYEKYISRIPNSPGDYAIYLAALKKFHASLSPAELAEPAIVKDRNQDPTRGKVFVTESEKGLRLVTIDRSYMDRTLPLPAIQLITLEWRADERNSPKRAAMCQFENNLDLTALRGLLDR